MKPKNRNRLIPGIIIFGILCSGKAAAVGIPPGGSSEHTTQNAAEAESVKKIRDADAEIKKIVAEITREEVLCRDFLTRIKKELEALDQRLNVENRNNPPKKWIPPRVAWALPEESE